MPAAVVLQWFVAIPLANRHYRVRCVIEVMEVFEKMVVGFCCSSQVVFSDYLVIVSVYQDITIIFYRFNCLYFTSTNYEWE